MTSFRPLLIASAFALSAVSAAQAGEATAGAYKLAIGSNTTCAITLAADGSTAYASDCAQGAGVAKWQARFNGVELKTARGETVALLKGKDGSYTGTRFEDGRALTLSSDSAVASTH
ncbi:MAG TPA: AprI/Inh family metalloprotease inhibitor [Rhizomicrobium sp.]|nr:AprI/Inh family metalloprotease inhibitor [Rhizomicrobium sp.]